MRIIHVSFLLLLLACDKNVYLEEFDLYVKKFIEAGKKRGVEFEINPSDVKILFGETPEDIAGKCGKKGQKRIITINKNRWEEFDDREKEFLIYHELGYCVLGRYHTNEKLPNGECLSLMDGKEDGFDCSNNVYSNLWHEYYMDELFNPNTLFPNWYKQGVKIQNINQAKRKVFVANGDSIFNKKRPPQRKIIFISYQKYLIQERKPTLSHDTAYISYHCHKGKDHFDQFSCRYA